MRFEKGLGKIAHLNIQRKKCIAGAEAEIVDRNDEVLMVFLFFAR